jgi:D-sedoheptulose 7-phosphate isomerase
MELQNIIEKSYDEHKKTIDSLFYEKKETIEVAGLLLAKTLSNEGTIFWCGNGGSASDSQHLAAELMGRFKKNRKALRSIALTADTSVLTCVANDYSYEDIFSRQIEGLGTSRDLLVAISTSGNSENIIRALKAAKKNGLHTLLLTGIDGGKAAGEAEITLTVPSSSTTRIQEAHILIGHILCEIIELELGVA